MFTTCAVIIIDAAPCRGRLRLRAHAAVRQLFQLLRDVTIVIMMLSLRLRAAMMRAARFRALDYVAKEDMPYVDFYVTLMP